MSTTLCCFTEDVLCHLDSRLRFAVGLLMARATRGMPKSPLLRECSKLVRCKLWAVVADKCLGNAVFKKNCKIAFNLLYARCCSGVSQIVDLSKI